MNQPLLKQILDELLNTNNSLSDPMIKLLYFAKETQNEELITFLDKEINGYEVTDNVPKYRRVGGQLLVKIQVGVYSEDIVEREIAKSLIEDKFKSLLTEICLYQGITTLETQSQLNKHEPFIYKQLPIETIHIIDPLVQKNFSSTQKLTVTGARVRANATVVIDAANRIRSSLLDIILKIKQTFGINITSSEINNNKDYNQLITYFMGTIINNTGDGNTITTGNNNQINVNSTIQKGDLAAFQKRLEEIGVEPEEIEEISHIVQSERPDGNNLGPKASGWIGKMVSKALSGASKIGISAAGNLLATAVKAYLNIS